MVSKHPTEPMQTEPSMRDDVKPECTFLCTVCDDMIDSGLLLLGFKTANRGINVVFI